MNNFEYEHRGSWRMDDSLIPGLADCVHTDDMDHDGE